MHTHELLGPPIRISIVCERHDLYVITAFDLLMDFDKKIFFPVQPRDCSIQRYRQYTLDNHIFDVQPTARTTPNIQLLNAVITHWRKIITSTETCAICVTLESPSGTF